MIKEDFLEKGKHNEGDLHPNGKWVWTKNKNGDKSDWHVIKKNKAGGKTSASTSSDNNTKPKIKHANSVANMSPQMLANWATKAGDDALKNVLASNGATMEMQQAAHKALTDRGIDMDVITIAGPLGKLLKLTTHKPSDAKSSSNAIASDDEGTVGEDEGDDEVTEKWYLNKEDSRVKKLFNLKTKAGRIKYDEFLYKKKKKEPDYIGPVETMQDLNEQYFEFLKNKEQRFMISAGGAGIGKTYGFNELAKLTNTQPFGIRKKKDGTEEQMEPGDADYDIFEAPDTNSQGQLLEVLKAHNGKIIVFDDNDKVLRRLDCAAVMKKATATTGKRIIEDPDDKQKNFEFTGKIIVMTNKDLKTLGDNEDTKAIISRAMMKSEIQMTVPETIEVMEDRYLDYEFAQVPRLPDPAEDKAERDEILALIKEKQNNIDPATFSTRTFQEVMINKRMVDNANASRGNAAIASFIGSKMKDWKKKAIATITKAVQPDICSPEAVDEIVKSVEHEESVEKAQNDIIKSIDGDMSLSQAEDLLLED